MRHHHAAAGLLLAGLTLTGCSSSNASHTTPATTGSAATAPVSEQPIPAGDKLATGSRTVACWRAIRAQYTPGTVQLTGAPTTPPQCVGLSTDEVSEIAGDVLEHQTD